MSTVTANPTITAEQWWQVEPFDENKTRVVDYFRHPDVPGELKCANCTNPMHIHGFLDEGRGYVVCPGDWILTLGDGAHRVGSIAINGEQL
jgi:hypothetical protein